LGQNKVQGLDYTYNLQGWLKGINSQQLDASKDMSQDGYSGSTAFKWYGRDVISLSLGYFKDDYKSIDNSATAFGMPYQPSTLPNTESGNDLYNGNISNATLAINKLNNGALSGYTYRYDQLNRLKQMRMHNLSGNGPNWNNSSILTGYQEDINYDGNGNILSYQRNGDANNATVGYKMDDLTYNYNRTPDGYLINNKLRHVNDAIPANLYATDLDDQSADYYTYDNIGNLITEGNENISWNLYGKIKDITNAGQTIHYTYDAAGNRISKAVTSGSSTKYTFYVRDPRGKVLGVYTDESNTLKWAEQHLYGSSRLGLWHPNINVTATWQAPGTGNGQINIGEREYELTNHLGNVLATISDGSIGFDDNGDGTIDHYEANILTAGDYYPFGMQMPGRVFNSGNYRYGFNDKENDNEIKGDGNQQDYGMRVYDTRLGRFLSVDPITGKYPELTPYQYASNSPIFNIDLDGLEGTSWWYRFLTDPANTLMTGTTMDELNSAAGDINNFTVGAIYNGLFQMSTGRDPVTLKPGASRIDGFGQAVIGTIFHYSAVRASTPPVNSMAGLEKQMATNAAANMNKAAAGATKSTGGSGARGGVLSEAEGAASKLPVDELDIPDLNPLREPGGWQTNCAGCTVAGDRALKGFSDTYAFNHGPVNTNKILEHFNVTEWEIFNRPKSILFKMRQMKEGATGVVFASRGADKVGHFFNVVNKGGKAFFVDFQKDIGERILDPENLKMENYKEFWFINTTH
jgi:RHS repeat-associated protein